MSKQKQSKNELLYQTEMPHNIAKPYSYQKGKVVGDEKWAGADEHTHTTLYK